MKTDFMDEVLRDCVPEVTQATPYRTAESRDPTYHISRSDDSQSIAIAFNPRGHYPRHMPRPSTLPGPWLDLANAIGGMPALQTALGWPYMVLYRRARGLVKIPKADRMLVDQLAKLHNLRSPLIVETLEPLELLGEALEKGYPPAPEEAERLKTIYTENDLIRIAETDNISARALRAVTHLLG